MQIHDDTALTFPKKLNSQATGATSDGDAADASMYLSILWCYPPICSPPFELTCRDKGCRQAQRYSPPRKGSAQKAPSWSGRCLSLRRALTRCLGLCPCSESHWWCWVWSLIRGSLLPSGNLGKRCITEMSQTCEQGHPWVLQALARFLIPPLPWAAAFPTC